MRVVVGGRDADAAIADAHLDVAAAGAAPDADPAPLGAVLDRVADQVLEDAAQRGLVAARPPAGYRRCRARLSSRAGVDQRRQVAHDVSQQRRSTGPARGAISAAPTGGPRTRGSARPGRSAGGLRRARARRTAGPALRRATTPSARLSAAERMTASGVRSSCDTVGDELELLPGQLAARGGSRRRGTPTLRPSTPRMLVLTTRLRRRAAFDGGLERSGRVLHEQPPRGVQQRR